MAQTPGRFLIRELCSICVLRSTIPSHSQRAGGGIRKAKSSKLRKYILRQVSPLPGLEVGVCVSGTVRRGEDLEQDERREKEHRQPHKQQQAEKLVAAAAAASR